MIGGFPQPKPGTQADLMLKMREPDDAERAAYHARMAGQLATVRMLFDAAVELHRCYDRNAELNNAGVTLDGRAFDETQKAEELWTEAKRTARRLARSANKHKTKPSVT